LKKALDSAIRGGELRNLFSTDCWGAAGADIRSLLAVAFGKTADGTRKQHVQFLMSRDLFSKEQLVTY
jgi:hypothetical protein